MEFGQIRASILGQEDPSGDGNATQSSILAWRIPWTRSLACTGVVPFASPWSGKESDTTETT